MDVRTQCRGKLVLHWDVFANFAGKDWETFVDSKDTESGLFRVDLKASYYYNFQFSDESKYLSLELQPAGFEEPVIGYLERSHPHAQPLILMARFHNRPSGDGGQTQSKAFPAIVKVRFPEDSVDQQVIIEEILGFHWVLGLQPLTIEDPESEPEVRPAPQETNALP